MYALNCSHDISNSVRPFSMRGMPALGLTSSGTLDTAFIASPAAPSPLTRRAVEPHHVSSGEISVMAAAAGWSRSASARGIKRHARHHRQVATLLAATARAFWMSIIVSITMKSTPASKADICSRMSTARSRSPSGAERAGRTDVAADESVAPAATDSAAALMRRAAAAQTRSAYAPAPM